MRDCLIHAGSKLTKLLADHLHHEPPVHGIGLDVLSLDPGRLYLGRLRSALQVRDVEACLQEQLLDQFNDRLLAAAAAAVPKGTHQATGSQAQEAAARLRPLLAALSTSGAAGAACVGRACAALQAKKRLKGRAVAAGLESCIAGKCMYRHCIGLLLYMQADHFACVSSSSTAPVQTVFIVNMCSEQPRSQAASGAWLLMTGVAEQDPAAPSWKFLQVSS